GSRFWACTSVTPLRDPAGRLIGYAKVVTDLTDRKREEDRQRFLATASRELAGSLDHRATLGRIARLAVPRIADIAAVYTFEDHQPTRLERVEATPDAMRTLREIEERYPGEARRLRPVVELARRRRPMVVQVTDDDLRKAAIDEGHLALLRRLRMRSIMVLPLEARGRLLGVIVLIRDATRPPYTAADLTLGEDLARRAALAVDNARLYEAALVANRARSDFLAIMSHELRTPLNAIVGYADLLLAGVPDPPPPGARRQILRIMASARHLRELIEDILSYSRIEAGREDVTLATTDLRNTLARRGEWAALRVRAPGGARGRRDRRAQGPPAPAPAPRQRGQVHGPRRDRPLGPQGRGSGRHRCARHRHRHRAPGPRAHLRAVLAGGAGDHPTRARHRPRPHPRPPARSAARRGRLRDQRAGAGKHVHRAAPRHGGAAARRGGELRPRCPPAALAGSPRLVAGRRARSS